MSIKFEYHQKLHHSQTKVRSFMVASLFEYHQKLHHSQTSLKAISLAMQV